MVEIGCACQSFLVGLILLANFQSLGSSRCAYAHYSSSADASTSRMDRRAYIACSPAFDTTLQPVRKTIVAGDAILAGYATLSEREILLMCNRVGSALALVILLGVVGRQTRAESTPLRFPRPRKVSKLSASGPEKDIAFSTQYAVVVNG